MDQDRLREVVEALLNDKGCTSEEAEKRRERAAKLMLKAGVTEEELLSQDADMLLDVLEVNRSQWLVAHYTCPAIARLSGCKVYWQVKLTSSFKRSDRKDVTYYGYRADVENARWLHEHVACEAVRALKASGLSERRQKEDFLVAFGARLATRLHDVASRMEVARAERTDIASHNALVQSKEAAIDTLVEEPLGVSRDRGRKKVGYDAYKAGQSAASRVSLGRPVDGSSGVKLLG